MLPTLILFLWRRHVLIIKKVNNINCSKNHMQYVWYWILNSYTNIFCCFLYHYGLLRWHFPVQYVSVSHNLIANIYLDACKIEGFSLIVLNCRIIRFLIHFNCNFATGAKIYIASFYSRWPYFVTAVKVFFLNFLKISY